MTGSIVTNARGSRHIRSVDVVHWDGNPDVPLSKTQSIDCDLVAVSGGFSPAVHLHSQSGGRNTWDEEHHCFVPGASVQESVSVGSCNGTWPFDACLAEGAEAGRLAASQCGFEELRLVISTNEFRKPAGTRTIQARPHLPDAFELRDA